MKLSPQHGSQLLELARSQIRSFLTNRDISNPQNLPPELNQPAGCFVSLHTTGSHRLRGCIGSLDASQPAWQAVLDSSRGVLQDPRFTSHPVTLEELPSLEVEISLLSPLRDASSPLDFDPLTDGIFLRVAGHSGCFLPQVARDTGWTREQLLSRLSSEKLGLEPDAWKRPDAKLQKFAVLVLGPVGF